MHFGIPQYRLPRDVLDGEIDAHRRAGRRDRPQSQGRGPRRREGGRPLRCGVRRGRRAPEQAAGHPRPRRRQDLRRGAVPQGRRGRTTSAEARPPGRDLRRRQHRHGRRAHGAAPRRRAADHLPPHREQMPAHEFEADEAIEEGVKIHWLRTIKEIDGTTFTVEVMELDEKGRPQPTGQFETLEADALILALGQDTDTAFLEACPASSSRSDGTVIVGPRHDDRLPRRVRRRRHGAVRAHRHDRRRPRQEGGAATSTPGCGPRTRRHCRRSTRSPRFDMLRLWYHAEAKQRGQSTHRHRAAAPDLRRGGRGLDAPKRRATRRSAACRAATASSATAATRRARRGAIIKLGPGKRYGTTTTGAPAARSASSSARAARSR